MAHVWNIVTDILSLLFVLACFGYAGYRSLKKSEETARLAFLWVITVAISVGALFVARRLPLLYLPAAGVVFGIILAVIWAPSVASLLANPIGGMFDGGSAEPEKKPMYSYAEARRRKGLPAAAVAEARKVLANFPDDFPGILLLASIQAEDLKDLPAAETTIEEFIARPKMPPQTISAALQNMADLQWRFGKGAAAATATLERITQAYPNTNLAHAALQRIAHLEAADQTRQRRAEIHFQVPTGERDVGLRAGFQAAVNTPNSGDEMGRLVAQLEKHPADVESREKLALIYAEELGRVDLAADQLEQLIALRAESPRRIARWLNLLATIHTRFGNDLPSAESALHRILERFPKSTMSEAAVTRLASLNVEVKANRPTEAKSLGSYEKQIGLKKKLGIG